MADDQHTTPSSPTVAAENKVGSENSTAIAYVGAFLTVVAATLIRFLLTPIVGQQTAPFITYFLAVVWSAWIGGFRAGALSILCSAIAASYFFVPPAGSVGFERPQDTWSLIIFMLAGTGIASIGEMQRRAQKQAESNFQEAERQRQAVQASRELLAVTLRSIGDAVITTDSEGRITLLNTVAEQLTGWTEQEAMGKPCEEVFRITNEETGEAVESPVTRVLQESIIVGLANHRVLISRQGARYVIDDSGAPIRDTSGRLLGVVLVFRDITEQRKAETARNFLIRATETLASSLDYAQTLQQVAQLAVPHIADWCAVDILEGSGEIRSLAVAHVNPEKVRWAREIRSRYPPNPDSPRGVPQVIRSGESELYTEIPDEMLAARAQDAEHLAIMRQVGFESVLIVPMRARGRTLGAITLVTTHESGRRFTQEDRVLAENLASRGALAVDNALLYQKAQEELGERAKTEQELRRSRHQLEVILEGIGDGITAQELGGRVVFANTAAARASGFDSVDAFLQTPLREIVAHYEMMDETGNPFPITQLPGRRALQGESAPESIVRVRNKETGTERWVLIKARPVQDDEGSVRLAINFFQDVTERRQTEETLRHRQKEIEALNVRLQRSMSETHHRIKNNLQVITALITMQLMEYEEKIPAAELRRLNQHIQALAAIHDLLTRQAKSGGTVETVPVREIMETLLPIIQGMVLPRQIRCQIEEAWLPVRQGTALAILVNELISNAIKYGRGEIGITLRVTQDTGRLEVVDHGPGFPPNFDPVIAAHTGLELIESLARWDMQGTTCYENRPEGGARVIVEFPLSQALLSPAPSLPTPAA